MSAGNAKTSLVASRYVTAFLDMAEQSKAVEAVEKDMRDLAAMTDSSEALRHMVESPVISRDKKEKAILALAEKGKFSDLTRRFLGVLARNGRLRELSDIQRDFDADLARRRGIVAAQVESAYALTQAQTKSLQEQIGKALGASIAMNVEVNKDLLGGMVVKVGSRMFDDSVRRKLERLGLAMTTGTHQTQVKEVG